MAHCVMYYTVLIKEFCAFKITWFHGTQVNVPILIHVGRVWPSMFLVYKAHTYNKNCGTEVNIQYVIHK